MKTLFILLAFATFFSVAHAQTQIKVGAYDFKPYYVYTNSEHSGLTATAVRILNSMQKEYVFEIRKLPPERRYQSFERQRVDMFLFEDPAWEWSKFQYEFIPLDINDGEVYITKAGGTATPKSYEDLKKLRIAIIQGYHYGFAGFETDIRYLKKNFKVEILDNAESCLNLVNSGRADVTVLAKSYVYNFVKQNPEFKDKFVISENYDSTYKLGVVYNPSKILRRKLDPLISELKKRPDFQKSLQETLK